jgi:SAM-dependent methyltransferase
MTAKARASSKAALRGEPSYVLRAGQERRFQMICEGAGERIHGSVFEAGCGIGSYLFRLQKEARQAIGLDIEHDRTCEAHLGADQVVCGAGENLPFPDGSFDLVLSNEVIEHVRDDRVALQEIVRTLAPGGRLVLFCPNRGYPFETHGIYWRGRYHFGNIPLVNYLPRRWRDYLAPHVRVYTRRDIERLFAGLPVRPIHKSVIFGAYDNVIFRWPAAGRLLRSVLQYLEHTPLSILGLSHFWVVEKL